MASVTVGFSESENRESEKFDAASACAHNSDTSNVYKNAGQTDPSVQVDPLHIDRSGVWSYGGSPFLRKEMICLLASCLRRTSCGNYEVMLPNEVWPIPVIVEDVPFLAVEVFSTGLGEDQILSFRMNDDRIVTLGGDARLYLDVDPATGENVPYISMGTGMAARVSRPVYYELVALCETREVDGQEEIGLWSNRQFFVLGMLE